MVIGKCMICKCDAYHAVRINIRNGTTETFVFCDEHRPMGVSIRNTRYGDYNE